MTKRKQAILYAVFGMLIILLGTGCSKLIELIDLKQQSEEEIVDQVWNKHSDVAQYSGASWDNFVKRVDNISLEDAKIIAEENADITFFFYVKAQSMYLNTSTVKVKTSPYFFFGDSVFFSGEVWLASASGLADTYLKQ